MWQHPKWQSDGLKDYAQFCNSVEGNTTFYQTPSPNRAAEWANAVDESFRFCFKLPQTITHERELIDSSELLQDFWQAITPLHSKIGVLMAQLPARFGPEKLAVLERFLSRFSLPVPLAIEVRHLAFFEKGEAEKAFNQMLIQFSVNRVILDSRALFSRPAQTALEEEVQSKKPRVPVNVIATKASPVVRFIGSHHDDENVKALMPWLAKIHQWREEGRRPYVFFHCPDNGEAPFLLERFVGLYNERYPYVPLSCNLSALIPQHNQASLGF